MKYITRNLEGIEVLDRKVKKLNKGIKQYINELCIQNLSTFEGRQQAAKMILNCTSNLPIYVDEYILLFPTKSIRNMDCIYINFHHVLSIRKVNTMFSKIIFDDLTEVLVETTHQKLQTQLLRARTIYEFKHCE